MNFSSLQILKGDGNDYITDGKGTNQLYGGKGDDTYFITYEKGSNSQTIFDSDGKGKINAGGTVLTGGTSVDGSSTTFKDENGFTYKISGINLLISNDGYSMLVRDFDKGDLGIHLYDGDGNNKVLKFSTKCKRCA